MSKKENEQTPINLMEVLGQMLSAGASKVEVNSDSETRDEDDIEPITIVINNGKIVAQVSVNLEKGEDGTDVSIEMNRSMYDSIQTDGDRLLVMLTDHLMEATNEFFTTL